MLVPALEQKLNYVKLYTLVALKSCTDSYSDLNRNLQIDP